MNIREHIEAGHYPLDEKGRALVPVGGQGRKGWTATIIATDAPEGIMGFGLCSTRVWDAHGKDEKGHGDGDLLPPPPRKVEVKRWLIISASGIEMHIEHCEKAKNQWAACHPDCRVVELTGTYEEPWS